MNAAKVLDDLKRRFPNEPEYHQAVEEVLSTIEEEYNKHPEFDKVNLIERLCIPDRVYQFRVTWMDDKGNIQTNMGYRVQHNNAIGPYKGGIRFHASVNLSILKFLAFEQTFKNSLTTLPMKSAPYPVWNPVRYNRLLPLPVSVPASVRWPEHSSGAVSYTHLRRYHGCFRCGSDRQRTLRRRLCDHNAGLSEDLRSPVRDQHGEM